MALKIVTAPAVEPVTLAEAKLHLRVDGTDQDTLIAGLIQAAREHLETVILGRALVTQTLEYVVSRFPCWEMPLPRPPLQSVTTVKYTDSLNAEHTLSNTLYCLNIDRSPGLLTPAYGKSWPTATLAPTGAIRIRYVAGYGLAAAVPQAFKQAILLLVGHLYANRELTSAQALTVVPLAVDSLCADRCFGNWED